MSTRMKAYARAGVDVDLGNKVKANIPKLVKSANRPEVLDSIRSQFGARMEASDIADAIAFIVTRPRHVAINEMLIRPTAQEA